MIHQLVLAFGLGTIFSYQSYKKAKPASNLVIPVLAIVVIFFGVLSTQRWKGEILSNKMMLVRESSNWNELIKYSVQADELWGYTLDPVSMPVLFYKGLAQLNLNQPDRSKASFQEALKIHPNNIHVINNLGGLYAMENDFENASYYYEKALVIAPYYQTGVLNLVSNYFNANRVEEAYEILRENEDRFDEQKEVYRNYLLVILRTMYLNSRDALLSKNQIQLSVEPTDSTLLELEIIAYQGNKSVVEVFKEHMLNENSLANP
jgi:tetratricopeptide (TPR) repeat protein